MAIINIKSLQPGKTYTVMVRAKDANGNFSPYSKSYTFTVPTTDAGQNQILADNISTVVNVKANPFSANASGSVIGGAITAGGWDSNGLLNIGGTNFANIWNNSSAGYITNTAITGSPNAGAVAINSTGILGYQFGGVSSSGQANFFLSTIDGNAYFRGTIYAAAGNIGGWGISSSSIYNDIVGLNAPQNKLYRVNLIENPSFEVNTSVWNATYGTLTSSGTYATIGASAGRYKATSASVGQKLYNLASVSVSGISAWTLSTYVYVPNTNSKDLNLYLSASGYIVPTYYGAASSTPVTITRGSWQRVSWTMNTVNVPLTWFTSGITSLQVAINTASPLGVGEEFWTDGWLLETGSDLLDYFDGSYNAADWSGTSHASTSLLSEPAFYAGSANSGRYNAPFIVSYDGTVRASDFSLVGQPTFSPTQVTGITTTTAITSWTVNPGATKGITGTGPESGRILVTLSAYIESDGNDTGVSVRIGTGTTINAGTAILSPPAASNKYYHTLVNNAAGANGFMNTTCTFVVYSELLKNRDFNIATYYLAEDTNQTLAAIVVGWYPLP